MARYKMLERAQLVQGGRKVWATVGEVVEYDGVPTIGMLPLDAEARAAKAESIKPHHLTPSAGFHFQILRVAKSLGGGPFHTLEAAQEFIDRWLAQHRAGEPVNG